MRREILSLFIILYFLMGCNRPSKEYYSVLDKQEIYFSSFTEEDDDVFWTGNDGLQRAQISNGEYYFESLEGNGRYNAPLFSIEPTDDFEIEISVSGSEDDLIGYYGMVIGQLKKDSSFIEFKINNSGSFLIDSNYPIIEGRFENINFKTFKKLTVRKLGNDFRFFINEELKYSYPMDELINVRTGPLAYKNSSIWVDFVRINKIKKPL